MSRDLSQRILLEAVCLQKQAEQQCAQQSLAKLHIHSSCCIETDPELEVYETHNMHKNLEGRTMISLANGDVEMKYSSVTARFLAREFINYREKMALTCCTQEEQSDVSDKLRQTEMSMWKTWHGVRYCDLECRGCGRIP